MKYGYARVSTDDQTPALQLAALKGTGCKTIFKDEGLSNESGRYEVYVRPFPSASGKWQISTEGGGEPLWSHNGRELFYRVGDKMMAVDIAVEPSFRAGTPRMLFEGKYAVRDALPETNFDISPDGQRFLMIKNPELTTQSAPAQINVVLNWFEELKAKVPVK